MRQLTDKRLTGELFGTDGGQACECEIDLRETATAQCQVPVQVSDGSGGVREIDDRVEAECRGTSREAVLFEVESGRDRREVVLK